MYNPEEEEKYYKQAIVKVRIQDMLNNLSSAILDAGGLITPGDVSRLNITEVFEILARNNVKSIFYYQRPFEIKLREKEKQDKEIK